MPELPEVETVRSILEPQIKGDEIVSIRVKQESVIAHPSAEAFVKNVQGKRIEAVDRRGKYLIIRLSGGGFLAVHLRMTGRILAVPKDYPEEKHTHVMIELLSGREIRYIDARRFGRLWYLEPGEEDNVTGMHKLGIEPDDRELSSAYLKRRLQNRKKAIKEMLHDQSIVAGIGNIYSDEILFDAGIFPAKKCSELSDEEWNRLAEAIPRIIAWGIETDRMTPEEYLAGKGKEYRNMPKLKVYAREREACVRCGTGIQRRMIGGRSSCFCPTCQRDGQRGGLGGWPVCTIKRED